MVKPTTPPIQLVLSTSCRLSVPNNCDIRENQKRNRRDRIRSEDSYFESEAFSDNTGRSKYAFMPHFLICTFIT